MLRNIMMTMAFATPAMAHEGGHFHPHGVEPMWMIMLAAAALVAGIVLGRMRK